MSRRFLQRWDGPGAAPAGHPAQDPAGRAHEAAEVLGSTLHSLGSSGRDGTRGGRGACVAGGDRGLCGYSVCGATCASGVSSG